MNVTDEWSVTEREDKCWAEGRVMGIEKICDVMRCSRLRWMGHVLRKEGNDWMKKRMDMTVEGSTIDDVAEVMRQNRLRWFGHVERRDELCWIKRIETLQVDGDGVKGRPKKRWR